MHKKIISMLIVFVALAVLLFVVASVIMGGQRNRVPTTGITNDVEWRGPFVGPTTPPHVNGPTGPAPAFPE